MGAALIVPFRPDGGARDEIWARLRARHQDMGRTVVEGNCGDGPWSKGAAIADALTRTDADLLVICDADVWVDGLDDTLGHVDQLCRWAVPHRKVFRLAAGVLEPTADRRQLARAPYDGYLGGGVVVIDRAVYEACPIDPRFEGWGQEDESFARALTTLVGAPWRGVQPLWHWWHPSQPKISGRTGSKASAALAFRYRRVAGNRMATAALIEEGRVWASPSTTPASSRS